MQKRLMTGRAVLLLSLCLILCACGGQGQTKGTPEESRGNLQESGYLSYESMEWENGLELSYASQFSVEKCEDYYLITIVGSDRFLLIPEKKDVPADLPSDVVLLKKPLQHVYLASSSVFDLVETAGAIEHLRFSGTKQEDLCSAGAAEAMEKGRLLYAGKYSRPDYELLVGQQCDLAIENTMIYHDPDTKEKLESLGIPVLVETSSYEPHPFGRMEWIKLYGLLFDRLEEAELFFDEEEKRLAPVLQQDQTGVSVAFFYVNSNGVVNVRKPGDYVSKMISLAGGEYVIKASGQEEENALSTMNMQMEDFYLAAGDAEVLIYNSTIVGGLSSVQELTEMNPLFADFRAVKEGRVYCTARNFFQEPTAIGEFVEDLSKALRDEECTEFHQLIKVP